MPSNALLAVALVESIARILLQYSFDFSLFAIASAFSAGFFNSQQVVISKITVALNQS